MQKDQNSSNQPKTLCNSCGRYILTSNFLLHQGRCQRNSELRSSRVSQQSQKNQYPQINEFKQRSQKKQYPSFNKEFSKEVIGSKKRNTSIFNEPKQVQSKIPCHFCGYMQTYEQLDTHPKQCQHWQTQCEFCKSAFPKSLMIDHKQICDKNPRNIERNHQYQMRRRNQMQRNQQHQFQDHRSMPMFYQERNRNMYSPSSLMDVFNHQFFGPSMGSRNQQNRQPGFNFFQFCSSTGNQPRIYIRSNSSNPATFIQLIQMLVRRANPNQNPGLNQQQLKSLPKVKYQRKNKDEPDLCTICYCQFQQNQQMIELKCKHMFHQQCIFEWLKRVSTCPVCKKKLKEGPNQQEQQIQQFNEGFFPQHQHQHNHRQNNNNNQGGNGFFW